MNGQRTHFLLWAILVGAVAGVVCGWFFGPAMSAVQWIGTFFLNALKMCLIPLITAAVITGVCGIGRSGRVGKVGLAAVVYYTCTTGLAVAMGLLLVNLIEPGSGITTDAAAAAPEAAVEKAESGVSGIFLQMVSPSLVQAAAGNQLLPIILFSLLFALALLRIGEGARNTIDFFEGLNAAMMKLVMWIMYLAPVGIFSLIAARLGQAGGSAGILQELHAIGWYAATVALGLGIHFLLLLGVLQVLARRGWDYLKQMGEALITAFGTASSSATLPLTIRCATQAGVDSRSVRFVLPLGATMNMDGTALYEAVAAVFIAQAYGIELSTADQFVIFITATLAAVGAAGIPQAGLVTMVIVLTAVNLPLEGIGLLLAIDWFLDRLRTTVNVWGDSVGAAAIQRYLPPRPVQTPSTVQE